LASLAYPGRFAKSSDPEELAFMAAAWRRWLDIGNDQEVEAAFDEWCREQKWPPSPADIRGIIIEMRTEGPHRKEVGYVRKPWVDYDIHGHRSEGYRWVKAPDQLESGHE